MKKLTIETIRESIIALICGILFIGIMFGGIAYLFLEHNTSMYVPLFLVIDLIAGIICYRQFVSIIKEISKL